MSNIDSDSDKMPTPESGSGRTPRTDSESDRRSSPDSNHHTIVITDSDSDNSSVVLVEKVQVEKKTFKKTSELTRRLKKAEEQRALKRARREKLREERREQRRKAEEAEAKATVIRLPKRPQIRPSYSDEAIRNEKYVEADPATLERLIMKPACSKTIEDNMCSEEEVRNWLEVRRTALEGVGLRLDPSDQFKVEIYVDFHKERCRNLNDPQEMLRCASLALTVRQVRQLYGNPKGQPPPGKSRVGFSVNTKTDNPDEVFKDAIRATDYLAYSTEFDDMTFPIGHANVMVNLLHHGFPKNGGVPSSIPFGIRLYEYEYEYVPRR